MKPDIEQQLEQLAQAVGRRDSFADEVMSRIKDSPVQHSETINRSLVQRRSFMKNTVKFSAAAAVFIGIGLLFLFNSGGNTIALAAVYEKVQQAQAYMYNMHLTLTAPNANGKGPQTVETEMTITMSSEYGTKMVNQITTPGPDGNPLQITQLVYQQLDDKTMISVIPAQKVYQKLELTDEMAAKTRAQNSDPREIIKQMLDCKYVSLGPSEINGVKVQGFETTDPAYGDGVASEIKATLWVDAETWLPYCMEMTMNMGDVMRIEAVADTFQWNIPVTAADFAVEIPADYTELQSLAVSDITAENLQSREARMESMMNIKKLMFACLSYSSNYKQLPESLDVLRQQGIDAKLFVNPQRPDVTDGYVYVRPGDDSAPQTAVMIYEAYEDWGEGINVGFADGHVEFMTDEAEFLRRLNP